MHRRDLVCRILAKATEVWRLMLKELGSRYVVFDLKKYSKSINQNEIVTIARYEVNSTDRYLSGMFLMEVLSARRQKFFEIDKV